jgi:RHS repeat-associated protein
VGRRRNPTTWTYTSVPQPVLIDRGFTGHEHYDNFGLIDMNGRMYDPVLGRFLGVDPIVQDAGNSQNLNGYGYCLNNPLKYTDPSGFSFQQTMRDLYIGSGYYYYRGGIYTYSSEGGWQYFQPTLAGGMAPAANLSYDAFHEQPYHLDPSGNLRDKDGIIVTRKGLLDKERGNARYGHWEQIINETYGGIHVNKVNSKNNPYIVDQVEVSQKWIWNSYPVYGALPILRKDVAEGLFGISASLSTSAACATECPPVAVFLGDASLILNSILTYNTLATKWNNGTLNLNSSTIFDIVFFIGGTINPIFGGVITWTYFIPKEINK